MLIDQAERLYCQDLPSFTLADPINYAAYNKNKMYLAFTEGGVAMRIPIPLSKMVIFFEQPQ